jgi:hypothetical protein
MWWYGLDWSVEDSCEHGNEHSGSIKCWEFLEWLHNWWLLKKGSALRVSEATQCRYRLILRFCNEIFQLQSLHGVEWYGRIWRQLHYRDYVASNGWMTTEELEIIWKEAIERVCNISRGRLLCFRTEETKVVIVSAHYRRIRDFFKFDIIHNTFSITLTWHAGLYFNLWSKIEVKIAELSNCISYKIHIVWRNTRGSQWIGHKWK